MESVTETTEVVRELTIAAKPETVWEFLVDQEKAKRWMGIDAKLEPEPGGLYRVEIIPDTVARGDVRRSRPATAARLHLGVGAEARRRDVRRRSRDSRRSRSRSSRTGTARTLRFEHRDLPTGESAARHGHGWDHFLPRLVEAASGRDPGRDPWLDGGDELARSRLAARRSVTLPLPGQRRGGGVEERELDVIVIGAGAPGEVIAGRLGEAGLEVAIVEERLVGGECSFYACMPSKALLRPVELAAEARRVPGVATGRSTCARCSRGATR